MEASQFETDLRRRVAAAREAIAVAEQEQDHFGVEVRTGELRSLLRIAEDNDVVVDVPIDADSPESAAVTSQTTHRAEAGGVE